MHTSNLTQTAHPAQKPQAFSNTIIILSNGEWKRLPEGADPDLFRKLEETRIKLAACPKKQKSTRRTGKPKKSINYAERVLAYGFTPDDNPIPFGGSLVPTDEWADDYAIEPVW